MLGYTEEELRQIKYDALVHPNDVQQTRDVHASLLHGTIEVAKLETCYLRKDNSLIDVEIRSALISDASGKPAYFVDIVEDITERKKARKLARETAENYRLLVENATEHGIFRLDEIGTIISWNPGAQRIFGYTADEVIGRPVSIFFTPEDIAEQHAQKEMEKARREGRAEDDRWHVRKDHSRFWASGMVTPARDESGHCTGFVKILRDLTDHKLAEERTLYLSQHDSLTALPNRSMFHEELSHAINTAKANKSQVGILFIDIDRFKDINDSLGHHTGDAILKHVAQRLIDSTRKSDIVARLGGDEFGIICSGLTRQSEAELLANKLVKKLSMPFNIENHQISAGASIGVTVFPKDGDDPVQILKNADMAMYRAKSSGRSNYQLYTENLDTDAKRRHAIEEALRTALDKDQLTLHYQPLIELASGALCGVEALLRWEDGTVPLLTCEELIAVADETGLIVPIGEWALRSACKQGRIWQDEGILNARVAVNLSSRQLKDSTFLRIVDQILEESQLEPEHLELEITESLLMENNQINISVLQALKKRGIHIAVDDFGTGFSSLSYLKHFPVDTLKIDQLFVKCLPENQHDAAIASAIIGMAHSLGMSVVAEGIEREEQLDFLKSLGCNFGQGFLFSPPVPPSGVFTEKLREPARRH